MAPEKDLEDEKTTAESKEEQKTERQPFSIVLAHQRIVIAVILSLLVAVVLGLSLESFLAGGRTDKDPGIAMSSQNGGGYSIPTREVTSRVFRA